MKIINHQSWGRNFKSKSTCHEISEFSSELRNKSASALPIGLGRSYGDASINSKGVYFSVLYKNRIQINVADKTAICEAGATIGDLERAAVKHGLFPAVVPGTEFVTIGGAIAADIHGKSHHHSGTFGNCVQVIRILDSNGNYLNLTPNGNYSAEFWATIGGMGLTGIIVEATIKLDKIESAYIKLEEKRANNLKDVMSLMKEFDSKYMYTVSWIDLSGRYKGRGIVSGGNHASFQSLPKKFRKKPFEIAKVNIFSLPDFFSFKLIYPFTVWIFNNIWFRKPLKNKIINIRSFLHPLDSVKKWNRLYGKKGFIQYQFQIPFSHEYFLDEVLLELRKYKVSSSLAVLKKFGPPNNSFLSFPAYGWTLSIDVSIGDKKIFELFNFFTKRLCDLGGKVYLAKDSLVSQEEFFVMYPKVIEWSKVKMKMDPYNFWQSDQGRRIGLC
jgi:decaprenylphospho-beta-D-ribofuranose 2-oxidase